MASCKNLVRVFCGRACCNQGDVCVVAFDFKDGEYVWCAWRPYTDKEPGIVLWYNLPGCFAPEDLFTHDEEG